MSNPPHLPSVHVYMMELCLIISEYVHKVYAQQRRFEKQVAFQKQEYW